jgi:hypothetical protein
MGRGFDRTSRALLPPRVRPCRLIVALMLAMLWLPATLHCGLAALGMGHSAEKCCQRAGHDGPLAGGASHESAACDPSACGLVESGDYQPAENFLKVSAPSDVVFVFSLVWLAPEPSPDFELAAADVESPPEIRRTWHFLVRAAPVSRAPARLAA